MSDFLRPDDGGNTMTNSDIERKRANRLRQAMSSRGYGKATAIAAALGVSPAAVTKWTNGKSMSTDHACKMAALLDVSLDWLLMGRNDPDWLLPARLSETERDLIGKIRERPLRVARLLSRLLTEIPIEPRPDESRSLGKSGPPGGRPESA